MPLQSLAQRAAEETHVHLDSGLSALRARFVPDGVDAWYPRSQLHEPSPSHTGARRLTARALTDARVYTGTLGLALCNPLTDGIRARNLHDLDDSENSHLPGIYTQRLVIDSCEGN